MWKVSWYVAGADLHFYIWGKFKMRLNISGGAYTIWKNWVPRRQTAVVRFMCPKSEIWKVVYSILLFLGGSGSRHYEDLRDRGLSQQHIASPILYWRCGTM